MVGSGIYPFMNVDKNFDANRSEVFIQLRYEFSEPLSLARKERVITLVEDALELGHTLADLAGSEGVRAEHVAEATQYRVLDRRLWLDG